MSQRKEGRKEATEVDCSGLDGMGWDGRGSMVLATLAASVSPVLATWLCVYVSLVTDCG